MSEPAPRLQAGGGFEPPSPGSGSLPVGLTKAEFKRLLRAPIGPNATRDRAILLTLYATACRASELCGMRWERWQGTTLRFWRPKVKRDHEVRALLPQTVGALAALRRATGSLQPTGPMFVGQRGPLTPNGLWRLLQRLGRDAGIPAHKRRPHTVRHGRAIHLLEDGCSLRAVQLLLGHRRITSTEAYLQVAHGWLESQLSRSTL